MYVYFKNILRGLVGLTALTLMACTDDATQPSNSDRETELLATEPPAPSVDVDLPRYSTIETIASDIYPTANLTGSVIYQGDINDPEGNILGVIEDTDPNVLQVYTPVILELKRGKYMFSVTYVPGASEDIQSLFRVRDANADDAAFPLIDVFVSKSGEIERQTGDAEHVGVTDMGDGFYKIVIVFNTNNDLGKYRFAFFPAAATEGRYEPSLVGKATIGNISIHTVQ